MNDHARLRVGVVGAGVMGERHAKTYAAMPDVDLVGIFDPDQNRANDVANTHGTIATDSLRALLGVVDAITIASPTPSHAEVACQGLEAGVHLLIEKPFTASLEEARKLVERVADARNLTVLVGHIERFNPVVTEFKRAIAGRHVRSATFRRMQPYTTRCSDTSVVHDLMIHDIDLALDLLGDDVDEVDAAGSAPMGDKLDHAIAQLFLTSGVAVTLIASRIATVRTRSIGVETEDAWISADLLAKTVSICDAEISERYRYDSHAVERQRGDSTVIHLTPSDALQLELEHFVNCVRGTEQPRVDAVAGLRAMIYADAIEDLTGRVARAGFSDLVLAGSGLDGRVAL